MHFARLPFPFFKYISLPKKSYRMYPKNLFIEYAD